MATPQSLAAVESSLSGRNSGRIAAAMSKTRNVPLQRSLGNQALGRLFAEFATGREALAGRAEPKQQLIAGSPETKTFPVSSVLGKGFGAPVTRPGASAPQPGAIVAQQMAAPSGAPTVHAGGGNDCTPVAPTLSWDVVDAGADWRADVTALNVSANIHITAWPSAPSSMTVPNTANPFDGGNINNTAGSPNHWQSAIDDMADYDTAGTGGAGTNWHSTAASTAHEWAHWTGDFLGDCIPTANWSGANRDIDAITVPKAGLATAAAARASLEPRVTARFGAFVAAVIARWNVLITTTDSFGQGGRGYAAGMRVLNGHIAAVRAYAASKGWTGMSRGGRTAAGAGVGALVGGGVGFAVGGPIGALAGAGIGGLVGGAIGYFTH